ncbi:MAG: MarR family transcriptional regulator [Ignavibacteriaceae bacterium]|nr:MarR family transcriptional regulator [Ignavibacteriaceae bacterium]
MKREIRVDMWVKLSRAYLTMNKKVVENIKGFGLTGPQFSALDILGVYEKLSLSEIGEKMLVSGANITMVIDNLEKLGFVKRVQNLGDRRIILVQITESGKNKLSSILQTHIDFVSGLTKSLSDDEIKQLAELLKKLGLSIK